MDENSTGNTKVKQATKVLTIKEGRFVNVFWS